MNFFAYSGKKKVKIVLKGANAKFLHKKTAAGIPTPSIKKQLNIFFKKNYTKFINKKVCIVIPDNTRDFHPKVILSLLLSSLGKISRSVDCIVSLGLHRKLSGKELNNFIGKNILKDNKIIQHSLDDTKLLGKIGGIPVYLNKNLFLYDVILTVGVVEPHLYAGFSGGIKCLAIGLAGLKTILATHSTKFLSKSKVAVASIKTNPFQNLLWKATEYIKIPTYSLNLINNDKKQICFCSLGKARGSFFKSVAFAKKAFGYKTGKKFDVLFVGCDFPKERSLYQVSRLFNYVLDKKPLVKRGGTIFIFANLEAGKKSGAENNFEQLLKKEKIPRDYKFKEPGEHRTSKVIDASRYATLAIITPNIPREKFSYLSFFKDFAPALEWSKNKYGNNLTMGIIPLGFSFIPY